MNFETESLIQILERNGFEIARKKKRIIAKKIECHSRISIIPAKGIVYANGRKVELRSYLRAIEC